MINRTVDIKWFQEVNSYQFYSKKIKNDNKLTHQNFSYFLREEIIKSDNNLMSKVMYTWAEAYLGFIKDKGFKYTHSRQINKVEFFEWLRVATNLKSLATDLKEKLWTASINSNLFSVYGDRNRKNINELILKPVTKLFDAQKLENSLIVRYVPKIKEKTSFIDMQNIFIEFLYGYPTLANKSFVKVDSQKEIGDILGISQQEVGQRMLNRTKLYQFKLATETEKNDIINNTNGRLIKIDNLGYNLSALSKFGVIEANGNVWVKMVGTKLLTNFKYMYRKIGKNNKYKYLPIKHLKDELNLNNIEFKSFTKDELLSKELKCVRFTNKDNLQQTGLTNDDISESQYISLIGKNLNNVISKVKSIIRVQYFKNELNGLLISPFNKYISLNKAISRLSYYCKAVSNKLKNTGFAHVIEYIYVNLKILKKSVSASVEGLRMWKENRQPKKRKYKVSLRVMFKRASKRMYKLFTTVKNVVNEKTSEFIEAINNFNIRYNSQAHVLSI